MRIGTKIGFEIGTDFDAAGSGEHGKGEGFN
jgi:hypothetical protein